MLSSNAMQDLLASAMSSMPRLDSHSRSKARLGCMYACMLRLEGNLGLASKAEKGWITARYVPAMDSLTMVITAQKKNRKRLQTEN